MMKNFKIILLSTLIFLSLQAFCQSSEEVEMADVLRQDGKIYTVVFGLVIILTAMVVFLIRIDKKIFRLEKEIEKER